ncbi:MAG: VOC family protein, partial [Candidatus Binatia bacterium]
MNQLRHLAIRTEEPEKLAAFYIEAFGFREVREGWPPAKGAERRSFHLTDGYFELAILANTPNQ